ncbi:hypothetical protein WMY93_012503 [Mugilogobius chulae]|uniref:Uncharacterized protein n=1 Tax=Mugilogobius chulae TaxID=88201 RepID=A0AAW0P960_9GOBI
MKYPEYTLLESKRLPWGWLFTMKVSVPGARQRYILEVCSDNKVEIPEPTETDQSNKPESVTEECRPSTDIEVMDEPEMDPQLILDQVHEIKESQHSEEVLEQTEEEIPSSDEESLHIEEEIQSPEEGSQHTEEEIQSSIEDIQQIGEIQLIEEQTEHTEEEIHQEKRFYLQKRFSHRSSKKKILFWSSQSQDTTTPECDQECSPEQLRSSTRSTLAQKSRTGSEEQSLCKTLDLSSSPSAEVVFGDGPEEALAPDGPTQVFKEADILPLKSDQECQKPSSETHVIKESTEQEEHNSPPQILDGPPVSHFLIQALVRKLTQNHTSTQKIRGCGQNSSKGPHEGHQITKMPLKAEDEVFQEAMLKHLNTRLSNFLFGPKKRGLSRSSVL